MTGNITFVWIQIDKKKFFNPSERFKSILKSMKTIIVSVTKSKNVI